MIDYYKILNISFGAPETEIKKRFRELATIHHPDKNGGSKKSEETFKVILGAYETLSDKEKREIYDIKYRQYFQNAKPGSTYQNTSNSKYEAPKQPPPRSGRYHKSDKSILKVNYSFWVLVVIFAILYLINISKSTTKVNIRAKEQNEDQIPENRPKTGELDFNKKTK